MQPAAVLAVLVKAQGVTPTNAGLKSVHGNLVKTNTAAAAAGASMVSAGRRMQQSGTRMAATGKRISRSFSLPLLAVGALSAKVAIDFEDSFAEVRKTVDATEPMFKRLEKGFRGLATQIPISVNELNELGGQAGALGVKAKDVLKFTKTAAELGTTTDLSSDEAANALARLSNIMGTSSKDFRRLASTFVDLGNKGASTEQEIADMSLRLAGSGKQVNLSESQVLSFASALSSVGVRAQAGGSAFSKVFQEMAAEVKSEGERLKTFGKVAGMTTDQFAKGFEKNAAVAMIKFVEGLDQIRKKGGNVFGVLEKLELNDRRVIDSLLRAAGAGKLFRDQLATGATEWKRNIALTTEANKRYGTTASELEIATNKLKDFGITLGQNLLPILAEVAEDFGKVLSIFQALPPGIQQAIVAAMALGAALGPLLFIVGNFIKLWGSLKIAMGSTIAFFGAQTTAVRAATIAQGQYAASVQAAIAAQRAQAAAGGVALASPVAMGGVGPAAGKAAASRFALSFARFLGPSLAILGLANIVSSAIGGDMKAAGFKAGGALVGGIAGAFIGGPLGAAIGGGLGSILGGEIEKLFGDSSQIRRWEDQVKESTNRVKLSMSGAKTAFQTVAGAQKQLSQIGRHQSRVSGRVERAENKLATLRKSKKAGAPDVRRAEQALARLKNKEIRLTRRQWSQERLLGGARNRGKQHLRNLREAEVGMIRAKQQGVESSKSQVKQARRVLETHTREGASLQTLTKDEERLREKRKQARTAIQSRVKWEKQLGTTMREIGEKFGPKYAAQLRKTVPLWTRTKDQVKASERAMRQLTPSLVPLTKQMGSFGKQSKESTQTTRRGFARVRSEMGPFRTETASSLGKAKGDMKSWTKASVKGVGLVQETLGGFAADLGIKSVKFGVKKGKQPKRQKGGMVVPGVGMGDKVPLTAMVEPGEIVHVLNSRAAKDKQKLGALETLNREKPRFAGSFAVGGSFNVDGAKPGFVPFMNYLNSLFGPIYVMSGLRPGSITTSGNMSNHATGNAVDISTTQNGLNAATDAGSLNATGAAAQRMDALHSHMAKHITLPGDFLWRTFTGGNHYNHIHRGITSAHAANPALMAQYLSRLPKGGGFGALPKLGFEGPDGALKEIGQGVLDSATKMATEWMSKQAMTPMFGSGKLQHGHGDGKIVGASTYGGPADSVSGTVGAAGVPLPGKMAFAELGMGQNLGGLPMGAKMRIAHGGRSVVGEKLDIGLGGGSVQGKRRDIDLWYQTAQALGLPGSWLGLVEVERLMKGGVLGGDGEFLGNLQKGSQRAGIGRGQKAARSGSPFAGPLRTIKKKPRKGAALVSKLNRKLEGMGFEPDSPVIRNLAKLTTNTEKFAEWAGNASALSTVDEEGNVTHGKFKGRTEAEHLQSQLGTLMSLRKQIIFAHGLLDKKVEKVVQLLREAKNRLNRVRKAIVKGEQAKRKIERRIKNFERAGDRRVRRINREKDDLERQLNKAQSRKKPNRGHIRDLRKQIRGKTDAIVDTREKTREKVKNQRGHLRRVNRNQAGRRRVESALSGTLIPTLETKRSDLLQTGVDLYSSGGSIGSFTYAGLQTVQGAGGTLGDIPNPPPLGSVGGELFAVSNRLREISEEQKKAKVEPPAGDSELLALERELNIQLKKENLALKSQFGVLKNFPSVSQIAMPFAGPFAAGGVMTPRGMVMAEVGERGPEMVFGPQGSRVVSTAEASDALRGGGSTTVVIQELVIHEDGTATVKVPGKPTFEADVEKVTRKQARSSMSSTPGGARRFR